MLFLLISCSKDCVEKSGKWVEQDFEVENFSKIIVNHGVELHILDGEIQRVTVKTGENKLDNIYFSVQNDTLEIDADSPCLFSENYDPIQVYITSPNVNFIRNSGEFTIYSDNTLNYSNLELISEDYQSHYSNYGNFDINVNTENLYVVSNGYSNFYISGNVNTLTLGFYSGLGRFDGKNLVAQQVEFYHRGSNSILVNPIQSLRGNLYSTGDIISYNHPEIVEVTQHYSGKLIYK